MPDVSTETLRLITKIYDATISAASWPEILDSIADHFGAVGAGILFQDHQHPELNASISSVSHFWRINGNQAHYEEHLAHLNPAASLLANSNPLQIVSSETHTHDKEEDRLFYEQQMADRFGISAMAAARLSEGASWLDLMTMQFSKEHGFITEAEKREWAILLPHIAKAMDVSRPLNLLKKRFHAVFEALDRFHIGVIILDESSRKVAANREATRILDDKDGLSVDSAGRVRAAFPDQQRLLQQVVSRTARTARGEDIHEGQLMSIGRRSGHDSYLVEVSPLTDPDGEIELMFKGALVYLIDPQNPGQVSTSGMKELFGLTAAESEVCRLVLDGCAYAEIAERRNVTLETVKSQIKSILGKTGVDGKAELVRLALRVNLPVDQA